MKFNNRRFISCLDTGVRLASCLLHTAELRNWGRSALCCAGLQNTSSHKFFLLHKNTCFFFLSLESKVISLLPYGTARTGRVKWIASGFKEQLCTTPVHLWLCQSKVWVGSRAAPALPCPPLPGHRSPSQCHSQAAPAPCIAAPAQSSSKAEIILNKRMGS